MARDILKGIIAGAAATWAMGQATTLMYRYERESARDREERARGGRSATETAAERIAAAAGVQLPARQRSLAASALHWSTGIAAACSYAVARRRWPAVTTGRGMLFGMGVFLVLDESMNTAFGFTPPPRAFPWQAHARGAVGHIVFGFVAHRVLVALDRMSRVPRRIEARLSAM